MKKFKYKVIDTVEKGVPLAGKPTDSYARRLELGLNKLGDKSWQLCAMIGTIFIFKK